MVTFFTVTLAISIVGLITLITIKQWELSTGHVLMAEVRPAIGAFLSAGLHWVERIAPSVLKSWARQAWVIIRAIVHRLAALGVLWAERILERTLKVLRHKTALPRSRDAAASTSPFLVEVAKHKRFLLRQAPKKEDRMIHEEL